MIHSNRFLFFCADCIFIFAVYFDTDILFGEKFMGWRLMLSVTCILSDPKDTTEIKIPSAQKRSLCEWIFASQYMRWRLILSVRCISSAHDQNNNTIGEKNKNKKQKKKKKQEPVGMNLWSVFAVREVCSKLQNKAKSYSAVFITNPLKIHFLCTFYCYRFLV